MWDIRCEKKVEECAGIFEVFETWEFLENFLNGLSS